MRLYRRPDVYDALSSRRPYKEPFDHEKSRAIILEGSGTHFDPDIVNAFLGREEQFLAIRAKFDGEGRLEALQPLLKQYQ